MGEQKDNTHNEADKLFTRHLVVLLERTCCICKSGQVEEWKELMWKLFADRC